MRKFMDIMESAMPDWQSWLMYHPHAETLLDNPAEILRRLPHNKIEIAEKVIADLKAWAAGDRKVYRVIGITDHEDDVGGYESDLRAAQAFAHSVINDPSVQLGNYWSRSYEGDPHYKQGGASMGYDVDAEGFPVVLSAICPLTSVHWGGTICANIAVPFEQEITIGGNVDMRYVAVDDEYTDFSGQRPTGPITHI